MTMLYIEMTTSRHACSPMIFRSTFTEISVVDFHYIIYVPSDSFNLPKPLCRAKISENNFFNRCVSAWNSLPCQVVESKSVALFKHNL